MIAELSSLLLTIGRYFTSIFVSLGVFLFGYDQGVMSGIITLVQATLWKSIANVFLEVLFSKIILTNPHEEKLAQWLPFLKSALSCPPL
jgi:hypothetical protein